MDVFGFEHLEQRAVERFPHAASNRVGSDVHAGLDRREIGEFGAMGAARGEPRQAIRVRRHEDSMRSGAAGIEPCSSLIEGDVLDFERGVGRADVMVVQAVDRLQVGLRGRFHGYGQHLHADILALPRGAQVTQR